MLSEQQIIIKLREEDCDLLDSIYLPSKYPLSGVLPDFEPDATLCRQCVAHKLRQGTRGIQTISHLATNYTNEH